MDKLYTVNITPRAEEAVREIARYIAYELLAPTTAIRLVQRIREEILTLDRMPERINLTPEEPWHSQGVRRMLVKNYYVYFWVNEDRDTVEVTDVIYARSDQPSRLLDMEAMLDQ